MVLEGDGAEDQGMLIVGILIGWVLLSVPVTLIAGRVLKGTTGDGLPGWTPDDDRELEQWWSHSDRLGR